MDSSAADDKGSFSEKTIPQRKICSDPLFSRETKMSTDVDKGRTLASP